MRTGERFWYLVDRGYALLCEHAACLLARSAGNLFCLGGRKRPLAGFGGGCCFSGGKETTAFLRRINNVEGRPSEAGLGTICVGLTRWGGV